jgi:hypothetical protein
MLNDASGSGVKAQSVAFLAAISVVAASYTFLRIYHPSATGVNVFFSHDLYRYYYQMYNYGANRISSGHFPLWNPWQACGLPFMATHQCGLFYPLNAIYLLMPTHIAMGAAFLIHLILSGAFTYLCGRRFGISPFGSLLAAITFMLGGHIAYHIGEPGNFYCAAWTPLMLYLAKRICDAPTLGNALLIGFFSSVQFMAGFEQHYVSTLYLMLGYFVFYGLQGIRERKPFGEFRRMGLYLLLAGGLTIGLCAIQLIPTLEMVSLSNRASRSLNVEQIIGLRDLVSLSMGFRMTLPNFFLSLLIPSRAPIPYDYVGLLPMIFLPLAFMNKKQRAHVIFLFAMILFCSAVVMAEWAGWEWVLHIPVVAMFRGLYRVMLVAVLCFGLLTGIGWDRLRSGLAGLANDTNASGKGRLTLWLLLAGAVALSLMTWRDRAETVRSVYVVGAFAFAFAALWQSRRRGVLVVCQVVLIVTLLADLVSGAFRPLAFPTRNPELFHRFDRVWEFLRGHQGHYRSYLQFDYNDGGHMNLGDKYGQLKGVRTITDYEPFASRRLRDFLVFMQRSPFPRLLIFYGHVYSISPETARTKLLSLMSARYILVYRSKTHLVGRISQLQEKWWSSLPKGWRLVYGEDDMRVFENPCVLPRAHVVHDFRVIDEPDALLRELDSASFDPAAEVLFSEAPQEPETVEPAGAHAQQAGGQIRFVHDEPSYVEIMVHSTRPGYLVLSDSYYPGWKATVNGKARPIYLANFMFRAVPVGAGESIVRFRYMPASFTWGLRISLASLVFLIVAAVALVIRSARSDKRQPE